MAQGWSHADVGRSVLTSVLVVEDDSVFRGLLTSVLTNAGYDISSAAGGSDGLVVARAADPDVILLDLSMPDLDGWQVLDALRRDGPLPAIIVVSAHHGESDIVRALEHGADDHITKPFGASTLLARVGVAARRAGALIARPESPTVLEWGPLEVNLTRRQVTRDGAEVDLTKAEFELLAALLERPTHVVTRRQLLDESHGPDWEGGEHSVDVHMSRLRRKLAGDSEQPSVIETVRGVGFRLVPPRDGPSVARPND